MLALRKAGMLAHRLPNLCYGYHFPGNSPLEIFILMINLWTTEKRNQFQVDGSSETLSLYHIGTFQASLLDLTLPPFSFQVVHQKYIPLHTTVTSF